MIADKFTDRILRTPGKMDIIVDNGQLVRIHGFIRVGDISVDHVEQIPVFRDNDTVAIGMPGCREHTYSGSDDLTAGEIVIGTISEIHRCDPRMIFQRLYFFRFKLNSVHIELCVRKASDFTGVIAVFVRQNYLCYLRGIVACCFQC